MHHEKKLAESSELVERWCGGEEEKCERDLDDVGGLGKKYILRDYLQMEVLNWRSSHHDAQFVKPIRLNGRKPGNWRWKALIRFKLFL